MGLNLKPREWKPGLSLPRSTCITARLVGPFEVALMDSPGEVGVSRPASTRVRDPVQRVGVGAALLA